MKTNELKKGDRVALQNGWEAEIADNMRGNTRLAKVFGLFTEIGSIYAHDIKHAIKADGTIEKIEYTDQQLKLRNTVKSLF